MNLFLSFFCLVSFTYQWGGGGQQQMQIMHVCGVRLEKKTGKLFPTFKSIPRHCTTEI